MIDGSELLPGENNEGGGGGALRLEKGARSLHGVCFEMNDGQGERIGVCLGGPFFWFEL